MGAFRVSDDAQSRSITDEREDRRNDEVLDGLAEIDALLRGIIPDIKAAQQSIIQDEAGSITQEKSSRTVSAETDSNPMISATAKGLNGRRTSVPCGGLDN